MNDLGLLIFLGLFVLAFLYGIFMYNRFVVLKHAVAKAWSNIDVLLKQRHDELPKLVEVCRQYMRYEQETLERVMRARAAVSGARERGDVPALGLAEGELREGLGRLFAVAEAYPELKANGSFRQLQARISQLEDSIADRREFYNESVNANNVRIEQFPDALIAGLMGFRRFTLLRFARAETRDVDVKALFKGY